MESSRDKAKRALYKHGIFDPPARITPNATAIDHAAQVHDTMAADVPFHRRAMRGRFAKPDSDALFRTRLSKKDEEVVLGKARKPAAQVSYDVLGSSRRVPTADDGMREARKRKAEAQAQLRLADQLQSQGNSRAAAAARSQAASFRDEKAMSVYHIGTRRRAKVASTPMAVIAVMQEEEDHRTAQLLAEEE